MGEMDKDPGVLTLGEGGLDSINQRMSTEFYDGVRTNNGDIPSALDQVDANAPAVVAGPISRSVWFGWVTRIMRIGTSRPLGEPDIPPLRPEDDGFVLSQNVKQRIKERYGNINRVPSMKALRSCILAEFSKLFWYSAFFKLMQDIMILSRPRLLENLIILLGEYKLAFFLGETPDLTEGFIYVGALAGTSLLGGIAIVMYFHRVFACGLRARAILSNLIFDKITRLSAAEVNKFGMGKIQNLMTTDAFAISETIAYWHLLWSGPLQLIGIVVLMYRLIGPSAFVSIFSLFLTMPFIGVAYTKSLDAQARGSTFSDTRLKHMNELLQGIKVVKLYGWTSSFFRVITGVRMEELIYIRKFVHYTGVQFMIFGFGWIVGAVATFASYTIGQGEPLTSAVAFPVLALIGLLQFAVAVFPYVLAGVAQLNIAVERLYEFLILPEVDRSLLERVNANEGPDGVVIAVQGSFRWRTVAGIEDADAAEREKQREQLEQDKAMTQQLIDIEKLPKTERVVALKEYKAKQKELNRVKGERVKADAKEAAERRKKSKAAQKIREDRWKEMQKAKMEARKTKKGAVEPEPGALLSDSDFEQEEDDNERPGCVLNNVDIQIRQGLTMVVGVEGSGKTSLLMSLSGELDREGDGRLFVAGQSAICEQLPFVANASIIQNVSFGTPLDRVRYEEVVDACALREDLKHLAHGDRTEIGERGINLSGGQKARVGLARAVYSRANVLLLDDVLSAVDPAVSKHIFDKCITGPLCKHRTVVLCTHQAQYCSRADYVIMLAADGSVAAQGTYQDLIKNTPVFRAFMDTLLGDGHEHDGEGEHDAEKSEDKGGEENKSEDTSSAADPLAAAKAAKAAKGGQPQSANERDLMIEEVRKTGQVATKLYLQYLRMMMNKKLFAMVLFLLVAEISATEGTSFLIAEWTEQDPEGEEPEVWVGYHALLSLGAVMVSTVRIWVVAYGAYRASRIIHARVFKKLMGAPLRWFDRTPLGAIQARFSVDLKRIDDELPVHLMAAIWASSSVVGFAISIAIVIRTFLIVLAVVVVLMYMIQKYFRRTSREAKRLQDLAVGPMTSLLTESVAGAVTLRAYNLLGDASKFFGGRVNVFSRFYFIVNSANRWLEIRIQVLGALIVVATGVIVLANIETLALSLAALALNYATGLVEIVQHFVQTLVEVENALTAVERLNHYVDTTPQEPGPIARLGRGPFGDDVKMNDEAERMEMAAEAGIPGDWPRTGDIELKNVTVKYDTNLPVVLNSVSCSIASGERIGIVGRSGAGKSTIMLTLFRLISCISGGVLIDGVDTEKIPRGLLRSRLTIVPQDPVLFKGSIRSNLDPFGEYKDEDMMVACEHVQLATTLRQRAFASMSLATDRKASIEAASEASTGDSVELSVVQGGAASGPAARAKSDSVLAAEDVSVDNILSQGVDEGGKGYSVGERQLLCLARALLRRTTILCLDECSANVSYESDRAIQHTLATEFPGVTVLVIAHRLRTVIAADRIMVIGKREDGGAVRQTSSEGSSILEFDSPRALLDDPNSIFGGMVDKVGAQSKILRRIARGELGSSSIELADGEDEIE